MAPVIPNPQRIRPFETEADFAAWMASNHDREPEIWVQYYKKASGRTTIVYAQALDVALCYGWIDGISKPIDEHSYIQRYTPRGRKSIWSQRNRDKVAKLIAEGRMTEHGLREIEAAKADGRWEQAYASSSKMEMPPDLLAAIEANPSAQATFLQLNANNRYALAFRTHNLKTEAGRKKRIAAFVEMLARGETPYPQKLKQDEQ